MSRHEFSNDLPDGSRYECTVGWDRPLNTFFAQVFHFPAGKSAAEEPVLWLGTSHSEIQAAAQIVEAVRPYCQLPYAIANTLEVDRMETSGEQDSPLQNYMRRLFEQ